MSRLSRGAVVAGAAAAVAVVVVTAGGGAVALASPPPATVVLAGTAAPFTSHTPAAGDLAAATTLSIEVWLRPDTAAAQRFTTAVTTPGSASYRHFLSPNAYTARFGPTTAQAAAVTSWLRTQGFTAVTASPQRDYVRATAPVSKIDTAFHVRMKSYHASGQANAGPYPLFANDRPLTLPTTLAPGILAVTGLDNAAPTQPLEHLSATAVADHAAAKTPQCSHYIGQHMVSGLPSKFGTTSFPTWGCGYSAGQLRAAYGANTTNTGRGQTVALFDGWVGAAGGGPSLLWSQPLYQKGVVPASMSTSPGDLGGGPVRSVPDVSADADPLTGMLMGILKKGKFTQRVNGGTSLAAPLVAGMVAAAQQGQSQPFGFLNPALYKLARTSAINDALPLRSSSPALWRGEACWDPKFCERTRYLAQFDAQRGTFAHSQVTAKGYDNTTGLGTPNGQSFITALRNMG